MRHLVLERDDWRLVPTTPKEPFTLEVLTKRFQLRGGIKVRWSTPVDLGSLAIITATNALAAHITARFDTGTGDRPIQDLYDPVLLVGLSPDGTIRNLTDAEVDAFWLEPVPESSIPRLAYRAGRVVIRRTLSRAEIEAEYGPFTDLPSYDLDEKNDRMREVRFARTLWTGSDSKWRFLPLDSDGGGRNDWAYLLSALPVPDGVIVTEAVPADQT